MEPSIATVSIDEEIIFKKADLKAIKDSKDSELCSPSYCICSSKNVSCHFEIVPNGDVDEKKRERTWLYFVTENGSATKIESDINTKIESIDFSMDIKTTKKHSGRTGFPVCTTKELFDKILKKNEELIVKVKGTMTVFEGNNETDNAIGSMILF